MEEKILEIIDRNSDKDGYVYDNAAKEITSLMIEFIEWLIKDQEIVYGDLTEKYILNDNPYKNGKKLQTIEEIFDYWLNNIKNK